VVLAALLQDRLRPLEEGQVNEWFVGGGVVGAAEEDFAEWTAPLSGVDG